MKESDENRGVGEGESVWRISRGASMFFAGNVVVKVLLFLLNLVLTRTLGATLYGFYAYADTVVRSTFIIARFGTGETLQRFVPKHTEDPEKQNWIVALAYLSAVAMSVTLACVLFFVAPEISRLTLRDPLFRDTLRILAISLPFTIITNITNAVFRSLEKLEYQIVIANVLEPVIRLATVVIAVLLGFSLLGIVSALVIGLIIVSIVALSTLYSRTDIHPTGNRSAGEAREFYNFAIPMTVKDIGSNLYSRVDILMVGFLLASSAVGIYRVSVLFATILVLPLAGINQLFPPIASKLYSENKLEELESVYSLLTRWIFSLVLPAALATIIYSRQVLSIFGPEFQEGWLVLIFFTVAQFTNCTSGPCGKLLAMTDHQYLIMANRWLFGLSNVVLNYVFIQEFGLLGAGLATASVLGTINITRMAELWYTEGIFPYSRAFAKPIGAGLVGAVVMIGLSVAIPGFLQLPVGAVVGGTTYLVLMYLFGIEPEDVDFYRNNIQDQYL